MDLMVSCILHYHLGFVVGSICFLVNVSRIPICSIKKKDYRNINFYNRGRRGKVSHGAR